ncbi:AAA family ATPase [Pseudomonas sp. D6002]|jgi:ABC-type branched-subunit amino acid transport system ATPase component|uniref:ATP-binding protein n=1 Tax=unclassified Pseudomonas TaxID=196821 RepID=UPI00159F9492|nr:MULTISPECIES: AAA family ATPase [unclassified Pseudomonas]NVZ96756.1 AAA family ATPase [Pseudomonas sp. B6001]NWB16875.1 AAA family ATPase [Pseudomonas sp. D6002]
MLNLVGGAEYKGFLLREPFDVEGCIVVLTGKNGVGKTRFLESIKECSTKAFCSGRELSSNDIAFLAQSALVPSFGQGYNDDAYVSKVKGTIEYFIRSRQDFIDPYDVNKEVGRMMHRATGNAQNSLSYAKLHELCRIISKKLDLPVSDLTEEHLRLNFYELSGTPFGVSDLSVISNSYRRRISENEFNEWRAVEKHLNVIYVASDKVGEYFGPKPWDAANLILEEVFDGKFMFSTPDEQSTVYDYVAELKLKSSGQTLSPDSLSSGERTLLWLVLTLFNTQYGKNTSSDVPKLLLIDEPDAFLHPKMVEKLYAVLNSFTAIFGAFVFITTHSPTTVALAPADSIYVVDEAGAVLVEKDLAISELLDGVNQISLDPENRLHVFVESFYDANLFNALYTHLRGVEDAIDSKVSLTFIPSGEKVPRTRIVEAMHSLVTEDEELISRVVAAINGVGSCAHVYAAVESFTDNSSKYVRGVVDWDLHNKPEPGVVVFAEGYAYTTENIGLDPISILSLLHLDKYDDYPIASLCGEDVRWDDWVKRLDLLQVSLDRYLERVIGTPNNRDVEIGYVSGVRLLTDSRYLRMGGELEGRVIAAYPGIKSYIGNGAKKDLKYTVVTKSMLKLLGGRFIPIQFVQLFKELQSSRPK